MPLAIPDPERTVAPVISCVIIKSSTAEQSSNKISGSTPEVILALHAPASTWVTRFAVQLITGGAQSSNVAVNEAG